MMQLFFIFKVMACGFLGYKPLHISEFVDLANLSTIWPQWAMQSLCQQSVGCIVHASNGPFY